VFIKRRRVQRVDANAFRTQRLGEIDREKDLRQLALRIAPAVAVATLEHDVREVDGLLGS
jgi:hypothetical protein